MTLKEMLAQAVTGRPNATLLRFKREGRWETLSYAAFAARVRDVAQTLAARGVRAGDRVGLLCENRVEWPLAYFAAAGLGATVVPVDPKLREQEAAHILRDAGARLVVAGAEAYALARETADGLPALEDVLVVGGSALRPAPARRVRFADFGEACAACPAPPAGGAYDTAAPRDESVASLIYTSGTTGRPKGAMLTHANFAANAASCLRAIEVRADDNFLLVLPLHHAFAFTTNLLVPIAAGAEISLVENLRTVGENLREVHPTILLAVPLLLEKIHRRLRAGIDERFLARALVKLGVLGPVRRAVRRRLGGRFRLAVSGGAPCDPGLLRDLARLGMPVIEGYGLTEAGPVVALNPPAAPRYGTVGRALPDVELRVREAGTDGVGEIACRGPNVMAGYYRAPEATREVLGADGWLRTGDLGRFDGDGYLTITGRRKALIVNREGKNIYPEEVEAELLRSPFILEALVLGYRAEDERGGERVGAIAVPDDEAADAHLGDRGDSPPEEAVEKLIREEVARCAAALADYKRPRRVELRWEGFEKTATGKIKRFLYRMGDAPARSDAHR